MFKTVIGIMGLVLATMGLPFETNAETDVSAFILAHYDEYVIAR